MTKREAAIVSAYTGYLIGGFNDFNAYAEEIMERPIFTHEFLSIADELKEKSKKDFMSIKIKEDNKKTKEVEFDAKKEQNRCEILGGYRKCKYGDRTKFGLQCEYLRCMTDDDNYKFPCPADSGTDGKRNGVCYEYANFTKEEQNDN